MPDLVLGPDRLGPARDDGIVHLADRRERTLVDAQARRIAEMRVAREENRHRRSLHHPSPSGEGRVRKHRGGVTPVQHMALRAMAPPGLDADAPESALP